MEDLLMVPIDETKGKCVPETFIYEDSVRVIDTHHKNQDRLLGHKSSITPYTHIGPLE